MSKKPDPDNSTLSKEELTLLHRVDERTERINSRVDKAVEKAEANADDIDNLQTDVQRNKTILGGFTVGATSFMLWVADKLSRFA